MRKEPQLDAYFDGSVFIGDSVMQGYGDYAMRRGGSCLGRMQFLAEVSFSVFNALRPVTAKEKMNPRRYRKLLPLRLLILKEKERRLKGSPRQDHANPYPNRRLGVFR